MLSTATCPCVYFVHVAGAVLLHSTVSCQTGLFQWLAMLYWSASKPTAVNTLSRQQNCSRSVIHFQLSSTLDFYCNNCNFAFVLEHNELEKEQSRCGWNILSTLIQEVNKNMVITINDPNPSPSHPTPPHPGPTADSSLPVCMCLRLSLPVLILNTSPC